MNVKPVKLSLSPKEYADFIVDFVNAETILAAYRVLFDGIYKLFIAHDDYQHEVYLQRINYIYKQYDDFLTKFHETEKKIVVLKMREAEALLVLHSANDLIQDNIIKLANEDDKVEDKEQKRKYLWFKDFDRVRKALVFNFMPKVLSEKVSKPDTQSLNSLKTIIDVSDHRLNPLYQAEYRTLINVYSELEKIENKVTNDRLKIISQQTMDELNNYIDRESDVAIARGFLRHFLHELTLNKELIGSTLIHTILRSYNQSRHDYYLDDEDDTIKMQSPFEIEEFIEWLDGYGSDDFVSSWAMREQSVWFKNNNLRFIFEWDSLIFRVCCFSLLQFINNKFDRKRLKKCPYCDLFFIAKDNKRTRCYSERCSKEYEKEKKRKQRSEDPVKYI